MDYKGKFKKEPIDKSGRRMGRNDGKPIVCMLKRKTLTKR